MIRSNVAILTFLIIVCAPAVIAQSVEPAEEIEACAKVTDRDARLACFDQLGQRVLGEESTTKETPQKELSRPEAVTTEAAKEPQPLPDDLGVSEPKTVQYSGRVTSCKKGHYGDWYFVFDNGQVWKEVNRKNRRFKKCDFDVTIMKDSFGYKMQIDVLDRTLRVKRHQ